MITSTSNQQVKHLQQLAKKARERNEQGVFLVEGIKMFQEAPDEKIRKVYISKSLYDEKGQAFLRNHEYEVLDDRVFQAVSDTKTPQGILCVVEQFRYRLEDLTRRENPHLLILENLQDPGNLGTIIRLADWFGIEHIFCSAGTADVYNPKTVQATMGALARVKVHYCSLPQLIESLADIPVYGTFLSGNIIYAESLSAHGLIVMGNEGKGVSPEVEKLINKKLYIPNYPQERETSESLNVAIATAVVCSEFRRRLLP